MRDKVYRVVVTRENDAWLADVPELSGAHTFARNIPGLDKAVREVIALVENLPDNGEDDLRLSYEYRTGIPEIDESTKRLRSDRERIRREEQELTERTISIARDLIDRYSMSVRDAAALTGVTKQRISQVAPTRSGRVPPAKENTKSQRATLDAAKAAEQRQG